MSQKIADRHASGNQVQARFVITIWDSGALSIEGPIEDKVFALAVLENAKDAIKNHRAPGVVDIVVPGRDVTLT